MGEAKRKAAANKQLDGRDFGAFISGVANGKVDIKQLDSRLLDATRASSGNRAIEGQENVIVFAKPVIDSGDFISVAKHLLEFSTSKVHSTAMAGRTPVMFVGWSMTDSSAWDDPKVREFIRDLTGIWPYWLHFLDIEDPGAQMLLRMLLGVRGTAVIDGAVNVALFDDHSLREGLQEWERLLAAAYALADFQGVERASLGSERIGYILATAPAVTA